MSDRTHVIRRLRRAWTSAARTLAAIIATAGLVLLAAACSSGSSSSAGSGGSSHAGGSTNSPSGVAFSACMRSHGVPNYPDPDPGQPPGDAPKVDPQRLGVSSSQFQAAQRACQDLLPFNDEVLSAESLRQCELTGDCPQALVQQALTQLRVFTQCMRSHGVPNWPDPTTDSQGRPGFAISISQDGFDPHSPQIKPKADECEHVMHPDIGTPLGGSP
jgi:hypothetical protein